MKVSCIESGREGEWSVDCIVLTVEVLQRSLLSCLLTTFTMISQDGGPVLPGVA